MGKRAMRNMAVFKGLRATQSAEMAIATLVLGALASPALAQSGPSNADADKLGRDNALIEKLKACQLEGDNAKRLACFDTAVGRIVAASETGEVRVVDREEIQENRRSLFGFNIPNKGLLAAPKDEVDTSLKTTVKSVRYITSRKVRFRTAEGAVWEIGNAPARMRRIEAGDPVEFKKAALGSYFVKVRGQRGVKGKRVE